MSENTSFNLTRSCKAKHSRAISSVRSRDVKAGFLDAGSPPEGRKWEGLPVGASPVTSGRAAEPSLRTPAVGHRGALARGESVLSLQPRAALFGGQGAGSGGLQASCTHAGPGRRPGPPACNALRSAPETAERVRQEVLIDLRGSVSQNKPDSAEALRAIYGKFPGSEIIGLGMGRPRSGDVLREKAGPMTGVARIYRIETVSLYDFVPKGKADRLRPGKNKS